MMILRFPYLEKEIAFNKDSYTNIVIENPSFLYSFIEELRNQTMAEEGRFLLLENGKELKFKEFVFLADNPMRIELDDKKIDSLIQKDISSHANQDQKEQYQQLLNQIVEYMDSLSISYSLPLSFDMDLPLSSLLKTMSLHVDSDVDDFLERLLMKIKELSVIFKLQIFVFLNLHDFLPSDKIALLKEECNRLEVYPLLVSSHLPRHRNETEKIIEIDEDLCELHIEEK